MASMSCLACRTSVVPHPRQLGKASVEMDTGHLMQMCSLRKVRGTNGRVKLLHYKTSYDGLQTAKEREAAPRKLGGEQ